ncbi:MAG: peptide-methionine (R)-S-oxide reductase MsrB [Actinomycetota bacterium]|nr:peptide-methionine (R)-S-oxide reductase MsrB [Acidimicrobiia bacterium]MDQ3293945.1 peptide-methionine (R)-S-oxide reductase MsrB [Actinomycetota bacterium]
MSVVASLLHRLRRPKGEEREVARTDVEWAAQLTPEQFHVLRRHGTDAPFGGPSVEPDAEGMYRCAGCEATLFRADTKFESGTGWPSFTDAESENVELQRDLRMGIPRTEVRCRRCGGHLGHVFGDGPAPTGKRYCINASALAPADRVNPS